MDALASLAPFDIEYTIAGRDFVLEARPATHWLKILLADQAGLDAVLPGWSGHEAKAHIYRSLVNGSLTRKQWEDMAWEIIGVAAGRRWWQAANLVLGIGTPQNWSMIYGHLVLRGLDPDHISFAAWLDAAVALCTEHMDKDERIKFNLEIDTPPAGVSPQDAIDPLEQERAFLAMMQAVNG